MTTVSTEQVQNDLPNLLERLKGGETLLIEQNGEPVGTLSPVEKPAVEPFRLGFLKGKLAVPDDIKTPFEAEINEMFYGD